MTVLKMFLGGESNNDLGTRWQQPPGNAPGAIEALLRRVRPDGWRVAGARTWKSIRKYRAGSARLPHSHNDVHNVRGLVLHAYEEACELLVFVRDRDSDEGRERAIRDARSSIDAQGFAEEYRYQLAVVGGVARPCLEGWILCLLGAARTDEMSRDRVARDLAARGIALKSTEHYLTVIASCALPAGDGSLAAWLAQADATLRRLTNGAT